jgi:hypothetical protein
LLLWSRSRTAGCSGGASATESQLAVCDSGREFAADVATDAYSWRASQDPIARGLRPRHGSCGGRWRRVGQGEARPHRSVVRFEPFLRFAETCEDVGSPLCSAPRGLLCDLQKKRRAERPNIVVVDDGYCA